MISFIICLAILIGGYFTYGKLVDSTFGPDDRETPAVAINDGIDYVVMPQWKLFLVQLLNIAGLGPIFGAMQGALWGPIVFLWITFGTIFAGAVHDYFSGMLSERNNGASIAEVTGIYLGPVMKTVMRVFCVVLLIMVGTVFAVGPAGLLVKLLSEKGVSGVLAQTTTWLAIILIYYFIATFISIDKIIGKIYPVFGIVLIVMAIGVAIGIPVNGFHTPELFSHFYSMHPKGTPVWSFMFITVACGAISGFHSTQSPLMARCLKSERQGHFVFYGAMVAEGCIALVWAAAGCSIYAVTDGLNTGLAEILAEGQSAAIYDVCVQTMGTVGVVLGMLGVVACPITSGDTAFRSARLTLADWFNIDQESYANRLKLCIPVLGIGAFLGFGNTLGFLSYTVIWRYFSWTNQTLAMIVLWAGAMFLVQEKKNYWICAVPATFMSAVSITYFVMAPECLGLIPALTNNTMVAYPAGIIAAVLFLVIFLRAANNRKAASAA
ncbi:MAG: carbon starvation protein A [Lachnospiraceae bacterium]|nr:carbon starvation protein A [Lachnospiraceae bacterium]